MRYSSFALTVMASAVGVKTDSLKDIKHIIFFMQENRSFDHYFGTMAGVRNFADPNVHVNDGVPVTKQPIGKSQNGVRTLSPWHINYLGGDWVEATQCMAGGSNDWKATHGAYNGGRGDGWVTANTANSMGYYTRKDVPTHFDIAEGWTVMDNSHQSIIGLTDPNRVMWVSGSVNTKGSPTNPDGRGGNILSNRASPGCDSPGNNCFPFTWKTASEYFEEAGISWRVWQGIDNFEDNMLAYFQQYQDGPSVLRDKGASFPGLDSFYEACANGTLPQVNWIVGPQEQSEHPPNMPIDGAWLQHKVVEAVTKSPAYKSTVLVISYDENGGWADHVIPPVAPREAAGEWIVDPFDSKKGVVPIGPGPRIPRYIISPWTRGGNVFAETGDHTSDIMFAEAWAEANGYKVRVDGISEWRRTHMTNMVNAFDFSAANYTIPNIQDVREPEALPGDKESHLSGNVTTLGSLTGAWVGPSKCKDGFKHGNYPDVPYGRENAKLSMNSIVEDGSKRVRGAITEGRYITLESVDGGLGLGHTPAGEVVGLAATETHDDAAQRWILSNADDNRFGSAFHIQAAAVDDWPYIDGSGKLVRDKKAAQIFEFSYQPDGSTYTLRKADAGNDEYVGFTKTDGSNPPANVSWQGSKTSFRIYGVNFGGSKDAAMGSTASIHRSKLTSSTMLSLGLLTALHVYIRRLS